MGINNILTRTILLLFGGTLLIIGVLTNLILSVIGALIMYFSESMFSHACFKDLKALTEDFPKGE